MVTEENTLGFEVEESILDAIMSGRENLFTVSIDANTQNDLLENVNGSLILNVEQLPPSFHGCWWYNNGTFPYIVRKSLEYIMLASNETRIVGRIVKCTPVAGERFRLGTGPENPSVWDKNGEDCLWSLQFTLEPADV